MSEFHHLSHRLAAAAATDLFNRERRERRERRSEITPQGGVGAPRGELKWNSPKTSKMITFFEGNKRWALSKWQMTSAISRSRCDRRIRRRDA